MMTLVSVPVRSRALAPALAVIASALLAACGAPSSVKQDEPSSAQTASAYNVQLGIAYLQQGNLALAKDKLERALVQNPRDPTVHSSLALLYERLGDTEKADEQFRDALRLAPRNPDVTNNYAVFLCRSGRATEGVKRFEEAARNRLYRTPEAAYTNAGVCLRGAKRDAEAEQSFLRALQIRPNFGEANVQLAELYLNDGRVDDAKRRVDTYLGAFNPTPDILWLAVRIARLQNDRLTAERYSRRLRMDFPNSGAAKALAESKGPG